MKTINLNISKELREQLNSLAKELNVKPETLAAAIISGNVHDRPVHTVADLEREIKELYKDV